ncbi:hypothetical protein GCM10010191_60900 [Actinomadura vinacea]|uniref:Uncharacterized protein n=1 Tax=Actinomadura vinacea TaxID=115336 RepID=A0ABN3JU28_9ACTN
MCESDGVEATTAVCPVRPDGRGGEGGTPVRAVTSVIAVPAPRRHGPDPVGTFQRRTAENRLGMENTLQ